MICAFCHKKTRLTRYKDVSICDTCNDLPEKAKDLMLNISEVVVENGKRKITPLQFLKKLEAK